MGFSVLQYVISQMRMYDIEDEIKKKKKKLFETLTMTLLFETLMTKLIPHTKMYLFCLYNLPSKCHQMPPFCALLGYHQSLLGNQVAILGSPLGNHLPIKFGKPCECSSLSYAADTLRLKRPGQRGIHGLKIDTIDLAVKSRVTRRHTRLNVQHCDTSISYHATLGQKHNIWDPCNVYPVVGTVPLIAN